ncbi:hypothetical protein ADIARSV_1544 [Arcticibacter svalbardensis MN12-7]|uniref:Uncharacterized protein n=1 Tax=Arcticibacter svalbardensis MN12-7 TaxID=1150600 RepID=R9GTU3_9SPHI|nr:hypothetical protein [Arcticibacter svalbardensis]EOR95267.1 hypothetical protein ADIARSV_1544 [Arcticibacter svalbardensis MN12-7]
MSHIRKKFDESADNDMVRAKHAVDEIAAKYAIEKQIKEAFSASFCGLLKFTFTQKVNIF